jgi:drug/metabolite transporter (DMT)-like permease
MKRENSLLKAYLALFGGVLFIGFAAVIVKLSEAPGIVTAFYRMAIALLILFWPFLFNLILKKSVLKTKGIVFALLAGICFGLDLSSWATGVVLSNATIPTLMANLAPVWVGFGSMILFKESHRRIFWVGLLIAVSGVIIVLNKDLYATGTQLYGSLLGILAGFFYGGFYLLSQQGRKILNTLSYLFISTLGSTVILSLFVTILDYNLTGYSLNTWLLFLAIGIGVQVFGWMMVNYSQGYLPASIVSATLLGQPLLTALFAIVFLHERLTIWHIVGGCIVIVGIYLVHYSKTNRKNNSTGA